MNIFTETPYEELWRTLLHYSYQSNLERYFANHSIVYTQDEIETISSSILQAKEYYDAATVTSLNISPLLLYYGTTNLLNALFVLLYGKSPVISGHGMTPQYHDTDQLIGDTIIHFNNQSEGGFHVFYKLFNTTNNLCNQNDWSLKELIGSIKEVYQEFVSCYGTHDLHVIPIHICRGGTGEFIRIDSVTDLNIESFLTEIPEYSKNYFPPERSQKKQLIIRKKLNGTDLYSSSISGQPFFSKNHHKNGQTIVMPELFYYYAALFALSSMCRYNPNKWNPFVLKDNSGERLIIEKFLKYSKRIIPNLVLNRIRDENIVFSNEKYHIEDISKPINEHTIKELITEEINKQERRQY